MIKPSLTAFALCLSLGLTHTASADPAKSPSTEPPAATKSGRVPVKGVDYHYQVHGQGEPLLLLHGGLMSGDMFGPVLPALTPPGAR